MTPNQRRNPGEWNGVLMPDDRLEPIPQMPPGVTTIGITREMAERWLGRPLDMQPHARGSWVSFDDRARAEVEGHKPVKV